MNKNDVKLCHSTATTRNWRPPKTSEWKCCNKFLTRRKITSTRSSHDNKYICVFLRERIKARPAATHLHTRLRVRVGSKRERIPPSTMCHSTEKRKIATENRVSPGKPKKNYDDEVFGAQRIPNKRDVRYSEALQQCHGESMHKVFSWTHVPATNDFGCHVRKLLRLAGT